MLLGSVRQSVPISLLVRHFGSKKDIKIATKITDLYINEQQTPNTKQRGEEIKRKIRYVYYNPTLAQRITILKARFFATGWIYLLAIVFTYLALKSIYWCQNRFIKDRFGI